MIISLSDPELFIAPDTISSSIDISCLTNVYTTNYAFMVNFSVIY